MSFLLFEYVGSTMTKHVSPHAFMAHLSMLNSNVKMMRKSRVCPADVVRHADVEVRNLFKSANLGSLLLDNSPLIFPFWMTFAGLSRDMSFVERRQVLGLDVWDGDRPNSDSREVKKLHHLLSEGQISARKMSLAWRVSQEAEWASENGWYPFVVTLTLDKMQLLRDYSAKHGSDGRTSKEILLDFWCDSSNFQGVINGFERYAKDALASEAKLDGRKFRRSRKFTPREEVVRYAAVLENGKQSGDHFHAHIVLFMRDVPHQCKGDPNAGRPLGHRNERRCKWLEAMIPYEGGSVSVIYFRHPGDAWSKAGHRMPEGEYESDLHGRLPIKVRHPAAMGAYLGKYMDKETDFETGGEMVFTHRLKATSGFGCHLLDDFLRTLRPSQLKQLLCRPKELNFKISLQLEHSVPMSLLRHRARRVLAEKLLANGEGLEIFCDPPASPVVNLFKLASKKLLPDVTYWSQSAVYDLITQVSVTPDWYDWRAMRRVHRRVGEAFPRCSRYAEIQTMFS